MDTAGTIAFYDGEFRLYSGGGIVAKIATSGQIYSDAGTTISSPADFAEWTKVTGNLNDFAVGTVVQQSDEDLAVEAAVANGFVYGVVTDRATFLGAVTGADKTEWKACADDAAIEAKYNAKKIAMVGHIQCKVVGKVARGKGLVVSGFPGIAREAGLSERSMVFALARENHDSEEAGLIEVRLL